MDIQLRLLAEARRDELERSAAHSRVAGRMTRCRQRLFGFLSIARPCPDCATC